ncbi:MAG TPA: hypothetical protein PKC76_14880 [Saprospiraceae bacterium]|nr:hypothetical protein [Saprospiraceae bacterium]HMP25417.1 hypothetical protein [Saprospiraceae bacterium]
MKKLSILCLLLVLTVFAACRKDNSEIAQLIVGRWEVQEALRNGRPTESLADLYFEFAPDGKLMTNVSGVPEEGMYELKGEKVLQRNIRFEGDYNVLEISSEKLVMTTEIQGFAFRFTLGKGNNASPEELFQ